MSENPSAAEARPPSVDDLLGDLDGERLVLRGIVEDEDTDFGAATPAPGWTVRDQVAHLAFYDGMAALALTDPVQFELAERAAADVDTPAYEQAHLGRVPQGRTELLAAWTAAAEELAAAARRAETGARVPWYGPPMSVKSFVTARIMETWAHGQDVVDVSGARREPTDRLLHVARIAVRARPFSYVNRGLTVPVEPVRVELDAPGGGSWVLGDPGATEVVRGPAEDFCLVLTRRRHVDDTTVRTSGALAREWMEIGQAYAGPPGAGPRRSAGDLVSRAEQEV